MYHKANPHIIETDDIDSLESMHMEEGTTPPRLTLVVRLHNHKPFVPKQLHLTNGVNHRILTPTGKIDNEQEEAPELSSTEYPELSRTRFPGNEEETTKRRGKGTAEEKQA